MTYTTIGYDENTNYNPSLIALASLYFIFGFITCLNDILVPHLKTMFALNYAQAMLIQFSFFTAYFIMSMPSGTLVDRFGYKRGMVGGLGIAALGCLLFLPAAEFRSYPFFLLALFVLATGITLLQVAANPFVALLGSPGTASARLTLTQGFNSLGTTVAPLFGALVILSRSAAAGSSPEAQRLAEAASVQGPYLGLAAALLLLAGMTARFRFPQVASAPATGKAAWRTLRDHPRLLLGAVGIFAYVGAEVGIGSFLVNYLSQPEIGGISQAAAARYVALYWGGAMVGRFMGAAVMRVVAPARVLVFNASLAMALVLLAICSWGRLSMGAILAVGFFNSILFPTTFTLALKGLDNQLGQASGLLCMAVVGGALVPLFQGLAADVWGIRVAFLLPVLCYAYLVFYGAKGHLRA